MYVGEGLGEITLRTFLVHSSWERGCINMILNLRGPSCGHKLTIMKQSLQSTQEDGKCFIT